MALYTTFYDGQYIEAAAMHNAAEVIDTDAQTHTYYDTSGTVTRVESTNAIERAMLATVPAGGDPGPLREQARAAFTANLNDIVQDAAVVSGAATITAGPATFTLAQLTSAVKSLAQGVTILANNDVNTKKELQAIIRLIVGKYDLGTPP